MAEEGRSHRGEEAYAQVRQVVQWQRALYRGGGGPTKQGWI